MQLSNYYNTKNQYNSALTRPIPLFPDITPEHHISILHNIYAHKDIKKEINFNLAITHGESGNWTQSWYTLKEALKIANNIAGRENLYISMNPFGKPKRDTDNIAVLSSLYLDIDCESAGMSADFALDRVFLKVNKGEFPMPNLITRSGHGLHLVFLINPIPVRKNPKVISLWQYAAGTLADILKEEGLNIDRPASTDPTRVLRLAGTINRKFGKVKKIVTTDFYHSEVYELRKITDHLQHTPSVHLQYTPSVHPQYTPPVHLQHTEKNQKNSKKMQKVDFYASGSKKTPNPNSYKGSLKGSEKTMLHNYPYRTQIGEG